MKRTLLLFVLSCLWGCGRFGGTKESQPPDGGGDSIEVRENGTPAAKSVYVTYTGPERLTRRFGRFFAIAADDYGIKIAHDKHDSDAKMDVAITEEEAHRELKGKILHAELILNAGKQVIVNYCGSVDSGNDQIVSQMVDYLGIDARNLAAEIKKSLPNTRRIFVEPSQGNLDSRFAELLKGELAKTGFIVATRAQEADAVLQTLKTVLKPFGALATIRRTSIKITGSANYTFNGSDIFYKSIEQPLPADAEAEACRDWKKFYLAPGYELSQDKSWNTAASTALALAKR